MRRENIPDSVILQSKFTGKKLLVNTLDKDWHIDLDGLSFIIKWEVYNFSAKLKGQLKAYIIHRLQTRSLATVQSSDYRLLIEIDKFNLEITSDFNSILKFLIKVNQYTLISSFKTFYKFGLSRNYNGFSSEVLQKIKEIKGYRENPYEKIYLRQNFVEDEDLRIIRKEIIDKENFKDYELLNGNIIVHLSYELAPRRTQFCSLNIEDFRIIENENVKFYSLNLPMSKKKSIKNLEKRSRKISELLGQKLEKLLILRPKINSLPSSPLFTTKSGSRIRPDNVGSIFKYEMDRMGLSLNLTMMRHNLAQSLADQGASAETIAEIMGHNSTYPARAYIAATPKIAEIKASALGKNKKYSNIIEMFTTGNIIEETDALQERWIKGAIGNQYIGGIGACGLPEDTICPKNPVFSCYTCTKFHPFKKGSHDKVKISLQKEVQKFIDLSESLGQIKYNRPVAQLEETISAVDRVIDKISRDE